MKKATLTRTVAGRVLIAIILCVGIAGAEEDTASPPNIIFLFADDQRADTISAHGNPHIHTPNLDQLANEGFSFRRNYCAGSFSGAVCVASRAMLMTGRYWMNLPANKPASNWGDSVVLPALLTGESAYRSFIIGKWHNGRGTLNKSFSNGRSVYMGGMANHADFQVQDLVEGKLGPKQDAGGFSSTVFANEAISFIQDAETDQPFFLYVAFMAPHDPRNPPEAHRQRYYDNRPPLPPNFLSQHLFKNAPQVTMGRDESLAPWPRTKEVISDQLCEYYGLVTHLDEQVGRVLTALRNSPHTDNTMVIYTADHGLAMGSHGLLGKQNVYEQSMRCPLILRGPGIPKGQSSNAPTYIHDLYATICDTAGIDPPEGVDSMSLLPIIQGKAEKVRDSYFLPFQDNQRAVSDGRWKLHVYPHINHRLLFDLSNDPHELTSLANESNHATELRNMEALMETWRKRLGDPQPLQVADPEDKTPNYNNATRVLDVWQPKWIRDKYFDGRENANYGKSRKRQEAKPHNSLSKEEKAQGWKLLFDGEKIEDWRRYTSEDAEIDGWTIQDGTLHKPAGIRAGNIMTLKTYEDFEFSWEWKLNPRGNNGVKYFIIPERKATVGHEYQMLDDSLTKDAYSQTAAFYLIATPSADKPVKSMGEWNHSRILVRGNHVEHWLNGKKVLQYECGSPAIMERVPKTKFRKYPGFGKKVKGHILLTDHKDPCWFRNLKIRELGR